MSSNVAYTCTILNLHACAHVQPNEIHMYVATFDTTGFTAEANARGSEMKESTSQLPAPRDSGNALPDSLARPLRPCTCRNAQIVILNPLLQFPSWPFLSPLARDPDKAGTRKQRTRSHSAAPTSPQSPSPLSRARAPARTAPRCC